MSISTHDTPAIAVSDLVKRYPKAPTNAVDGVSFAVRQGEIFGLLGPNGAGKTTVIGVLTTRVRPTGGTARLMGRDVTTDPIGVKRRIAVVPQMSDLDRSLKVRDILTFHGAYHSVPRKERRARADALLAELGLAERATDDVSWYSGGMHQRLMIARALMHAPDVLFLDEPTNNLDPQSRLFLWERIRALNARGLTILLTTHDMDEAERLCERIAIMDHGKILVDDTPDGLQTLIPGGTALELRVRVPDLAVAGGSGDDEQSGTRLLQALRALPGVIRVEEVGAPASGGPGGGGAPGGPPGGSVGSPWRGGPASPWGAGVAASEQGVATYRLYAEDARALVASANQAIVTAGAELHDLHLKRPSLEDVFIHLTGRALR